jgi:hypothetical protein
MLRTIEIANTIGMASCIIFGRFILSRCAMVEVTTIREDCEFEDTDYLDEDEGVEKLKDVKGNFILLPHKDINLKTRSSSIVLPQKREDEGTPNSQITLRSTIGFTPSSENHTQTTPENPPPTQSLEHYSPPRVAVSKSPPHTTHLQDPPPTQPLGHHSPQSQYPPHTTTPQNQPTE